MAASLVISLDFELMWGVRDHRTPTDYGDAVIGVRSALPAILDRFSAAGIRATWATVGLLFARSRQEMLEHAPAVRPLYTDPRYSPYAAIESGIGSDERDDPLHYGRSLLDRIRDTEGQEIATHTYSHFYCLEDGASLEAFDADLQSAKSIAAAAGVDLRSIVFPRNQMSAGHLQCCVRNGLSVYRGNPGGFAYRPRSGRENTALVRAVRLLDGIAPVARNNSFAEATAHRGILNVPSSRFLRPWSRKVPFYSRLHVDHVLRELRDTAVSGTNYHLWWHPHNMGRSTAQNLAQLDRVIAAFRQLRESHGMTSRNMGDFVDAPAESLRK